MVAWKSFDIGLTQDAKIPTYLYLPFFLHLSIQLQRFRLPGKDLH